MSGVNRKISLTSDLLDEARRRAFEDAYIPKILKDFKPKIVKRPEIRVILGNKVVTAT
jgi:hypothetical protein